MNFREKPHRPHRPPLTQRHRNRKNNVACSPDQSTAPSLGLKPTSTIRAIHAGDGPGGYSSCPGSPERIDVLSPVESIHVKTALIRAAHTPTDTVAPVILRNTWDSTPSAPRPRLLEPPNPVSGIENSRAVVSPIRGHDTEAPPPRKKRYSPSITPFTHEPHTFHRFIRYA